jgi:hypothetical protein
MVEECWLSASYATLVMPAAPSSREHIIALEPLEQWFDGDAIALPLRSPGREEYFDDIQDVKVTKDISPSHFSLPRYGRRVGLHITCLLGKLPSGS